jgi:hypothetical protein
MRAKSVLTVVFVLAALICTANNQLCAQALLGFSTDSASLTQDQPKQEKKKSEQDKKTPDPKSTSPTSSSSSPQTDRFDQDSARGSETLSFFNPQMLGDFSVYATRRIIAFYSTQSFTTITSTTISDGGGTITTVTKGTRQVNVIREVWVPSACRSGFNVAENGSPIPQDRVFIVGNSFSDVRGPQPNLPIINTTRTTTNTGNNFISTTATTSTTTVIPGTPNVNVYREIFGVEKTFLGGTASVELRAPYIQQTGNGIAGLASTEVGDLTIIGKYAFYMDRNTGNVISGGLAVTAPTSSSCITTTDGMLRDTLLQPFVGYLWNFDRFYVQAFHSVVIPTDQRDVTVMLNDVGLNYWLYRSQQQDSFLRCIVPTVEAHVTTPLNHRNEETVNTLFIPDMFVMTTGVHIGLFRNSTLSLGVATPVTGPRIFGVEGFVQLNWRY